MNCGLASGMISSFIQKASTGSVSSHFLSQVGFQCAKSTNFWIECHGAAETEAAAWLVPEQGQQVVLVTGKFFSYPQNRGPCPVCRKLKEKVLRIVANLNFPMRIISLKALILRFYQPLASQQALPA